MSQLAAQLDWAMMFLFSICYTLQTKRYTEGEKFTLAKERLLRHSNNNGKDRSHWRLSELTGLFSSRLSARPENSSYKYASK